MLHLKVPTELAWLDLPCGVRVQVRPPTTASRAQANATVDRLIGELIDDIARHKEAGASAAELPDLADPDVRMGLSALYLAIAAARSAIVAWEGVAEADSDAPAPVNAITVADLMRLHPIGEAFTRAYLAPLAALDAEGNGLRPAPDGTGGTGPAIAPDAAPTDRAAPTDESAPTASAAPTSNMSP